MSAKYVDNVINEIGRQFADYMTCIAKSYWALNELNNLIANNMDNISVMDELDVISTVYNEFYSFSLGLKSTQEFREQVRDVYNAVVSAFTKLKDKYTGMEVLNDLAMMMTVLGPDTFDRLPLTVERG